MASDLRLSKSDARTSLEERDLEDYQKDVVESYGETYHLDGALYNNKGNCLEVLLVFHKRTASSWMSRWEGEFYFSYIPAEYYYKPEKSVFMTRFQAEALNQAYIQLEESLQEHYDGFIRLIPMRVVRIKQGGYGVRFTLPSLGQVISEVNRYRIEHVDNPSNWCSEEILVGIDPLAESFVAEAEKFYRAIDKILGGKFANMPKYPPPWRDKGKTHSNFFISGTEHYCLWPIDVSGILEKQIIKPTGKIEEAALSHSSRYQALNEAMWKAGVRVKDSDQILQYPAENYVLSLDLRFRGNLGALDYPSLCFTGTRSPSRTAKIITEELSKMASRLGIVPFACFVGGVDMRAHKGAVDGGGMTVAVTHDMPDYPDLDELEEGINCGHMFGKIFEHEGLVISPYLTKQKGDKSNKKVRFYQRDSLVSTLSDVVVVVEGKENSGTVDTAMNAIAQGKMVYLIDWRRINDPAFEKEGNPNTAAMHQIDLVRSFIDKGGCDPMVDVLPSGQLTGTLEDWLPKLLEEFKSRLRNDLSGIYPGYFV